MRKVDVPEGTDGPYRIERFTVTEDDAEMDAMFASIAAFQGRRQMAVPEGTYTRLMRGGAIVMSDTPQEMYEHLSFVRKASGRVLIAGLGIGMVLQAVLDKDDVGHVTVVELSEAVLRMVAPHYRARYGERVEIVQGNILDWCPPKDTHLNPYDAAWFDIWDTKCSDHVKDMTRLNRRFARWARWKGCWAQDEMRHQAQRDRRYRGFAAMWRK